MAAAGSQRSKVACFIAWIESEILVGIELQRIDEDRHNNGGTTGCCCSDQRAMTVVQGAHGRHERKGAETSAQRRAC